MEINVVNKYHGAKGEYIGRSSPLGNPFVIGKDGNRDEVITKYVKWIGEIAMSHTIHGLRVRNEIKRLHALAQQGPLNLVCFCAPKACHGDVIKEILLGKM